MKQSVREVRPKTLMRQGAGNELNWILRTLTGARSRQSVGIPRSNRRLRPESCSSKNDHVPVSGSRSNPGTGGPIKALTGSLLILEVESMIRTEIVLPEGTFELNEGISAWSPI